jgi:hypothetical protein
MVKKLRCKVVLIVIMVTAAGALLQCLGATAWGQTAFGAITGLVQDSSGAVLPDVTVTATSPALIENSRSVSTDSAGLYKLVALPPGTYSVTFSAPGFSVLRRDNIEITADFTATVNAPLKVGVATQTVTVTTASPLVDATDVNAETTLSQEALVTMPVSRTPVGFAAVTLGAIVPLTNQDVGGSQGESWIKMAIHGGHQSEQKLLMNGITFNAMVTAGRNFFPDALSTEEVTIANGEGGSAEAQGAGTNLNWIWKEGSNQFHGALDLSGTNSDLESTNLTPYLVSRGATQSSAITQLFDFGAGASGKIIKDRLWWFASAREWANRETGASLQYNSNPNSYTYVPNGVAVVQTNFYRNAAVHFSWKATRRQTIEFGSEKDNNHLCCNGSGLLFNSNPPVSVEANDQGRYKPNSLNQFNWTMTVNPKLVLFVGSQYLYENVENPEATYAALDGIGVVDTGIGITYRAPVGNNDTYLVDPTMNSVFTASYVTGSHYFKIGGLIEHALNDTLTRYDSKGVSYTFVNGVPSSITEYAATTETPGSLPGYFAAGGPHFHTRQVMWPTVGLFVQDQWTIKHRLTLSYGIRYDHRGDYVPTNWTAAGVFVPARTWSRVDCVPCWNDLSPRIGAAYDLRGNGKTVIKSSLGRYVEQQTTVLAAANDPTATVGLSTTRSWKDTTPTSSPNYYTPNCNLQNPAANGDCGAIANSTFGTQVVTTKYDPNTLNGWQHSPYDWQMSVGVEQMFGPNVALSAMYYRTWYGNFTVTDNLDDPSPYTNYSPYCITAPSNAGLPGGGGNQICGLYDLNPSQVGLTNNYVTFASSFGRQNEIYNGIDLLAQARLMGDRLTLNGGVNFGNSNGNTSSQSDCFVVNSPQQLYQCNQPYPEQAQLKIQGLYKAPWGFEFTATEQNIPGVPITATYSASNTIIEPSLGRNLSACSPTAALGSACASASISLIQPNTLWENRVNQTDMQITKNLHITERITVRPLFILANMFNSSAITAENSTYGSKWKQPTSVINPRLAKFGLRVDF